MSGLEFEMGKKRYAVNLELKYPVDFGRLGAEFRDGGICQSALFINEGLTVTPRDIYAITHSRALVIFYPRHFLYFFDESLEEGTILNAIKSSLELSKKLEEMRLRGTALKFNPNSISLGLGTFDNEDVFVGAFGPIARDLQKMLYRGGNVGYAESSNDFRVRFGTDEEIGKKVPSLEFKKMQFEGTAQPANSLDELLVRIEQK